VSVGAEKKHVPSNEYYAARHYDKYREENRSHNRLHDGDVSRLTLLEICELRHLEVTTIAAMGATGVCGRHNRAVLEK
jgi:hypothetical protein